MCGRYVFDPGPIQKFYSRFDIEKTDKEPYLRARYNIAPGQKIPVITRKSPNKVVLMKWGLIPHWAKDPSIGYKMINARSETVATKSSYKKPFRFQRCIVPSSGFYEWKKTQDVKTKTPYFINLINRDLFTFAGLYDIWRDTEGKKTQSFSIITCEPNDLLSSIHNRMPVILSQNEENIWLDKNITDASVLTKLLDPYNTNKMQARPVSRQVNSPKNDYKELLNEQKENMLF